MTGKLTAQAAGVRLFAARDVERLVEPLALIDGVAAAFAARAGTPGAPTGVLGIEVAAGGFHVKAAALAADAGVMAVKLNGNFPRNPSTNGLPTIQGLVLVVDVANGAPLAILESASVTRLRTAAASAVAIRALALADADELTMIGCGVQAYDQVRFAHAVRPLRRVQLVDTNRSAASALADRLRRALGVDTVLAPDLSAACRASGIIITCTTAREPILHDDDVAAGTVVIAAGADNPHKHEIDPALMKRALVITDDTAQCARIGDLHHTLEAGAMRAADVHAELGAVLAGSALGRLAPTDRIVFDSTGVPLQDAALATLLLRAAGDADVPRFDFAS